MPSFVFFFAIRLANLANVLVLAMPIDTGIPVHWKTKLFILCISLNKGSPFIPLIYKKASSIEYTSTSGVKCFRQFITLDDISPYKV